DRKQLDGMLRQIVFSKLMTEQLDECGLSLRSLRRIVETLVDTIMASAHDRITYPWQEEERERERAQQQEQAGQAPAQSGRSMPIADGGSGAAPVEYEPSAAMPLSGSSQQATGEPPLRVVDRGEP
ncbi:MAG: hypothetical protein KC431_02630, partial [Myxococcales bacterium]|nr:hypothetical protein [Myxococcales bacterium]